MFFNWPKHINIHIYMGDKASVRINHEPFLAVLNGATGTVLVDIVNNSEICPHISSEGHV